MEQFGTTIKETVNALKPHLGQPSKELRVQAYTRITLSFLLLIIAVFFIIKTDLIGGESIADIGKMILGALIGYWLK